MKYSMLLSIIAVILLSSGSYAFTNIVNSKLIKSHNKYNSNNGARGMTAVFDSIASMVLSSKLSSSTMNPGLILSSRSFPMAQVETVQGMYKEYTVERVDDSSLDQGKRNYKTQEETDEGKTKYWALFAVLLGGSFIIPMAQYYWYVAEDE